MLQRILSATLLLAGLAFSVSTSVADAATSVSDAPAPFALQGAPRSLGAGTQQAWRVKVNEDGALSAIFKGGMWLPNGTGGREYARYSSHILHPDGSWTWIGKIPTKFGEQSVVITFGKDAVFGRIPQGNDYPLRLETEHGVVSLVRTSGAGLSRSTLAAAMRAKTDARAMPLLRAGSAASAEPSLASAQTPAVAAAATNVVIDVMVAYTPGVVSEYGSQSAAITRINNLVAITNQAYADSQVNQRIRLVNTVQVNYADNTSNESALDDITGVNSDGAPVPIPASLSQIATLRKQFGADLVSLLRRYDNATNGGCGLAWIIGGNEQPIVPSTDSAFGYSVVGDGSDGGYYCLDTSFAHELGHNMGDAHDRANADNPGAYPYSYGFKSTSSTGFATIMAYGDPQQQPLAVFSNPNISICQNQPCGVADSASNSADNAHSMNNTAALIAQFMQYHGPKDVNGDGKSDLLLYNASPAKLGWWLINGSSVLGYFSQPAPAGSDYKVVATGDFNGDRKADVVWSDSSGNIYLWTSTGSGFVSTFVAKNSPGWTVVGAGDVNGDGLADLLVYNPSPARLGWWLMNGAKVLSYHSQSVNSAWKFAGSGDFNGDTLADVLWTDASNNVYMWTSAVNSFNSTFVAQNSTGWSIVGTGDVDGDGNDDILVYNASPARLGWWLMSGPEVLSYHSQNTANANWKFSATGDYNGDGTTDVAWLANGNTLYFWMSLGSSFQSTAAVGKYTPGWTIIP